MWNRLLSSKLLALPRLPAGRYLAQDHLDHKHFLFTLLAALLLHVAGLIAWHMTPKVQVVDIPVHALNIKLGDSDVSEENKIPQPVTENKSGVENTISRLVRDPELDKTRSKTVTKTMDKAMKALDRSTSSKLLDKTITDAVTKPSDIARHYVRSRTPSLPKGDGVSTGNSDAKSAELVSRYEQLISLWIQKFKVYPEEARAQGLQGDTIVRIRIDRQGTIRYYILEHSTGHQLLDRAAIDMIRRANPVPAVPNNYPPGDLIEFLIPVNYHLQ